jgi:hypothetical protein
MEFYFQSNSLMNSLKCPKSKSLSHCLTELFLLFYNLEKLKSTYLSTAWYALTPSQQALHCLAKLFPIYQYKHLPIRQRDDCSTVLYWRLSDFYNTDFIFHQLRKSFLPTKFLQFTLNGSIIFELLKNRDLGLFLHELLQHFRINPTKSLNISL